MRFAGGYGDSRGRDGEREGTPHGIILVACAPHFIVVYLWGERWSIWGRVLGKAVFFELK